MTDKQKQAISVLNTLHRNLALTFFSDDDYFLLLDFVVGQQQPIINVPFQRREPYYPYETWITTTPFDPKKNYEPDGIFGPVTATTEPTMQGKSASSGLDPIRLDELREMQGGKCKED